VSDPIKAAQVTRWFRVQDRHGRGPFKPGMPARWRDPDGNDFPAVQEQFGLDWRAEIPRRWFAGCALRSIEQVTAWFSAAECSRLDALGYRLACVTGVALRDSHHQTVIVRPRPFTVGAIIMPWPHIDQTALVDPWKLAAAVERAARDAADG
jgi:hypothetical protein